MEETIIEGTKHVLEFISLCGVEKMLFTSSGAVYGQQPPELSHIDEEYLNREKIIQSHSVYGDAKLQAEKLCQAFILNHSCEIKIARCFAFVGPYLPLNKHFAIGNFILDGLQERNIHIKGDGTPLRSYLYAADLMIWLWHILMRGQNGREYNVGSEEAINIAELAEKVAHQFEPASKVFIAKKTISGMLPPRYVPSTKRAQQELGLKQRIDLSLAIQKTKQWYQDRIQE